MCRVDDIYYTIGHVGRVLYEKCLQLHVIIIIKGNLCVKVSVTVLSKSVF